MCGDKELVLFAASDRNGWVFGNTVTNRSRSKVCLYRSGRCTLEVIVGERYSIWIGDVVLLLWCVGG